ncbi:hypothetical protein R1sor_013510 [Riccia sorocarpa]|uniref:Reverse transcriptase zinc-binding domain-containing protein n=1 Tax=Riccia sorocarpa TaxID=122646 RepID=A0ABD3H8M5_9MARC
MEKHTIGIFAARPPPYEQTSPSGKVDPWGSELPLHIDWKALRQLFKKYWIFTLRDLVNGQGQLRLIPGLGSWLDLHGDTKHHMQQVLSWISKGTMADTPIDCSSGWFWNMPHEKIRSWKLTTTNWKRILSQDAPPRDDIGTRWRDSGDSTTWNSRWKALRKCKQSERQKTWIWRLLRRGFFTESRAEKMGLSDGCCSRCQGQSETFEHLFWGYPNVRSRWLTWSLGANRMGMSLTLSTTLLELLDNAISLQDLHPGWFAIVTVGTHQTWRERNLQKFQIKRTMMPAKLIVKEAIKELSARGDVRSQDHPLLRREISKLELIFGPRDAWTYLSSDDDDEDQGVAAPDTRTEGERDPPYRGHPGVNEGEDERPLDQLS